MVGTEPDYNHTVQSTVVFIYWESCLGFCFILLFIKKQTLRKWDAPYYFSLHSCFQRKKKKVVNQLLFTVSITQTDRQGNEAENQGAIEIPPKAQGTVYT